MSILSSSSTCVTFHVALFSFLSLFAWHSFPWYAVYIMFVLPWLLLFSFLLFVHNPQENKHETTLASAKFCSLLFKDCWFQKLYKIKGMTDIVPIYLIHILYLMSELLLKNTSRSVSIFIPIHFWLGIFTGLCKPTLLHVSHLSTIAICVVAS